MNLTLNNDMSLEKKESFYVKLSETAISIIDEHLVLRSFKKAAKAEIKIIDDECKILYSTINSAILSIVGEQE